MGLPYGIYSNKPEGNSLRGIIYQIVNKYGIKNPLTSKIIELDSPTTKGGELETIVLWNNDCWKTYIEKPNEAYVQMKFPGRFLFPSAYSIRGTNVSSHYAKSWDVFGFNEGDEENRNNWELLAKHTAAEGNFCDNIKLCNTKAIATYMISQRTKGFRYIRWSATESSTSNIDNHFATSGIEVYGLLSKSEEFCLKRLTCKSKQSHAFSFLMLFILFS